MPRIVPTLIVGLFCLMSAIAASAHGVDENTKQFLLGNEGVSIVPFLFLETLYELLAL